MWQGIDTFQEEEVRLTVSNAIQLAGLFPLYPCELANEPILPGD
jgi:hypothetical protein